jgi:hypothetical protein
MGMLMRQLHVMVIVGGWPVDLSACHQFKQACQAEFFDSAAFESKFKPSSQIHCAAAQQRLSNVNNSSAEAELAKGFIYRQLAGKNGTRNKSNMSFLLVSVPRANGFACCCGCWCCCHMLSGVRR